MNEYRIIEKPGCGAWRVQVKNTIPVLKFSWWSDVCFHYPNGGFSIKIFESLEEAEKELERQKAHDKYRSTKWTELK